MANAQSYSVHCPCRSLGRPARPGASGLARCGKKVGRPNPHSTEAGRWRAASVGRSVASRRDEREARIVGLLTGGASVAEIADQEGVSLKRMRNCLREILARREPRPPVEFLVRETNRLNEALRDSFDAMVDPKTGRANFQAIDRVVSIVRALDRVNGFSGRAVRPGSRPRRPLRRAGQFAPRWPPSGSQKTPQTIENARFGLGLGSRFAPAPRIWPGRGRRAAEPRAGIGGRPAKSDATL